MFLCCLLLYSPCYSRCAASLAWIPPGGLGLSALVHEKAHPSISNLLLKVLMLVASTASWSNWFHLFGHRLIFCLSCLSVLSVTLVYCGQTVGRIKMKLGTQVGLSPGRIMLDKDPAPLPQKGGRAPIFGPCLLWPNDWMDHDAGWY